MRFVPDAPAAVLAAAKEMLHKGLTEGTAGNISARQEDGTVVITPSSIVTSTMGSRGWILIAPT